MMDMSRFSPQLASRRRDANKYLCELLAECQKLGPFVQVLPNCSRLLTEEITSVAGGTSFDHNTLQHGSSPASISSGGFERTGWASFPSERAVNQAFGSVWCGVPVDPVVKRTIRIEVPVDIYPNVRFVGRLLGPRGNSLKRIEIITGCCVYIRGMGSIQDTSEEEKLRNKAGYDHLMEPLHVLIEAEKPASVIDTHLRQAKELIEQLMMQDESHEY